MFAIFELMSIVGKLVDQQFPHFIAQRSFYKARKRLTKKYSWKVFMLGRVLVEIPWYTLASVSMWALFYFPLGFSKTPTPDRMPSTDLPVSGLASLRLRLSYPLDRTPVTCVSNGFATFDPPVGQTCGNHMAEHVSPTGGYLLDSEATNNCQYCRSKETNVYLATIHADYDTRWCNFGIMWVYIAFNVGAALILYWVTRVSKGRKKVSE
jgi:ABC-type multidrug transport system permease subunit